MPNPNKVLKEEVLVKRAKALAKSDLWRLRVPGSEQPDNSRFEVRSSTGIMRGYVKGVWTQNKAASKKYSPGQRVVEGSAGKLKSSKILYYIASYQSPGSGRYACLNQAGVQVHPANIKPAEDFGL